MFLAQSVLQSNFCFHSPADGFLLQLLLINIAFHLTCYRWGAGLQDFLLASMPKEDGRADEAFVNGCLVAYWIAAFGCPARPDVSGQFSRSCVVYQVLLTSSIGQLLA